MLNQPNFINAIQMTIVKWFEIFGRLYTSNIVTFDWLHYLHCAILCYSIHLLRKVKKQNNFNIYLFQLCHSSLDFLNFVRIIFYTKNKKKNILLYYSYLLCFLSFVSECIINNKDYSKIHYAYTDISSVRVSPYLFYSSCL